MAPRKLKLLLPLVVFFFHPCCYGTFGAINEKGRKVLHFRSAAEKVVNVMDYGAKGDGSDATKAFALAWKDACLSQVPVVVFMVPGNRKFLLKPVLFSGPCKSRILVRIIGTVVASPNRSDWDGTDHRHWILFYDITNLHVDGGGTINGNGEAWWKKSCKINKALPCKIAPTAVTFYLCNDVVLENLRIRDSQQIHVSFEECSNVRASNLLVTAPERSPNTDGIHIANTNNIQVTNSVIRTGDDCISIAGGSKTVTAKGITCGPGHGISIGSLGANHVEEHVSDVVVEKVSLNSTTNGVRIKTWQGGRGHARNIAFKNIIMHNVTNPIIIDQNYCDSKSPCQQQKSAVQVSNVLYENIKGISATEVALTFDCSNSFPCRGIVLENIELVGKGRSAKSICRNVNLGQKGKVAPIPCSSS